MAKPDFEYEKKYWEQGVEFVIGIDEVGRGCFAGPLVVGAVAFAPKVKQFSNLPAGKAGLAIEQLGIDDSKRLKPKERERLAREIKKYALAWDITEVGVSVINRIGIGKATEKAMRKAVGDITKAMGCVMGYGGEIEKPTPTTHPRPITHNSSSSLFILTDFYNIPYLRGVGLKNQKGIKKGDQKSISIAAASILAKVYRDKLMLRLSEKHKKYGWGRNKGYGTKEHQEAILRYGLTRHHRKQFVRTWVEKRAV